MGQISNWPDILTLEEPDTGYARADKIFVLIFSHFIEVKPTQNSGHVSVHTWPETGFTKA